jgi:hypothetical protein
MRVRLLAGLLLLSSCGLVSKYGSLTPYGNGLHSSYAKALTTEDAEELNSKGEIYRPFQSIGRGDTVYGSLRIVKTKKEGVYNFIEIDEWYEKSAVYMDGRKKGDIRRITVFDSLGNIMIRHTYNKPRADNAYFLFEEWESRKDTFNGKQAHLQEVKVYNPNGSTSFEGNYLLKDFLILNSHRLKKDMPIDTVKAYDKEGKLKEERVYDTKGELIDKKKYGG